MNNPYSKRQKEEAPESNEGELSLFEILHFLEGSYKTIAIAVAIGLTTAVTYLAITPKQYEAVAQIVMAKISASQGNNNNLNPLGIGIEEPSLLIARLSQPTSFTQQVIDACKADGDPNPGSILAKSIKLAPPKGAANVVEIRAYATSPQDAQICANAVFELIKTTQAQIVSPYIEDAKARLLDNESRLAKAKDLIAKADMSGSAIGAVYLSTRDEIRFLMDEITTLKNVVTSNQIGATRLIAPVYVSDKPVTPKKQAVLVGGLFGGMFLGVLVALVRQMFSKYKSDLDGES